MNLADRIRAHCSRPGSAVLFDEPGGLLLDVPTGKSLALGAAGLERVEEKKNAETGAAYLVLYYGDGRQLALTDAGVAFAPDFRNVGAIAELPQAVCLSDFHTLLGRVRHELHGHPDRAPSREVPSLLMSCIAILDGARAAGFDIGREEREAEHELEALERRRG